MKFKPFARIESICVEAESNAEAARTGKYTGAAAIVAVFVGYTLGHIANGFTTAIVMMAVGLAAYFYGVRTLYRAFDPRTKELTIELPQTETPSAGPSDDDTAEMPVITADQVLNYARNNALQALELPQDGRMNLPDARANLISAVNAIDNHMMAAN